MGTIEDILVNVGMNTQGFQRGAKSVQLQLTKIDEVIKRLSNTFSLVGGKINNQIKKPLTSITEAIQATKFTDLNNEIKSMGNLYTRAGTGIVKVGKSIKATGGILEQLTSRFQGWALSIMFFGMAIQRLFMGITKFAFKTFNEIISSTEGAVSSVALLSASWQYLGFVIGSILEPIIPVLMSIIMWMAEWVEEHPRLARWLIIIGVIVGTLMTLLGILVLGILGIVNAMKLFEITTKIVEASKLAWIALKGVVTTVGAEILTAGKAIKTAMVIPTSGWALAGLLTVILIIIGLIIYAGIKWQWNWKAMFAQMIVWFFQFIEALHLGLITIMNAMATLFSMIVDGIFWVVNQGIKAANWLREQVNKLLPEEWQIGVFTSFQSDLTRDQLKNWDQAIIDAKQDWADKINPWQEVLDEWTNVLTADERLAEENAEPESELDTAVSSTNFNIDQLTVQANDAEGLVAELKNLSNTLNLGGFE